MTSEQIPLIDREILFGNPEIMGAQISPDGSFISFIKPYQGMLNIWVKSSHQSFDDAQPITNDQTRPIMSYFWTRDSKYIIYVQDKGGDENYHLHVVDPSDRHEGIPEARDLTPDGNIRAIIYGLPKNNHDIIYIGINDRDPAWHDLYAINITSGERDLLVENVYGINAYYFDLDYNLSLGSRSRPDAGQDLLRYDDGAWTPLISSSGDEHLSILKHNREGQAYINTNVGEHDLAFLGLLDINSGAIDMLEKDPQGQVDFGGALFSSKTDDLIGTAYTFQKSMIYWKDKDFEADYNWLRENNAPPKST